MQGGIRPACLTILKQGDYSYDNKRVVLKIGTVSTDDELLYCHTSARTSNKQERN